MIDSEVRWLHSPSDLLSSLLQECNASLVAMVLSSAHAASKKIMKGNLSLVKFTPATTPIQKGDDWVTNPKDDEAGIRDHEVISLVHWVDSMACDKPGRLVKMRRNQIVYANHLSTPLQDFSIADILIADTGLAMTKPKASAMAFQICFYAF